MIFLSEIENMKIYRKPFFIPYNDDDIKHGSLIYLLTPSIESSINLIHSPLVINRKRFVSYYTERNVLYYTKTGRVEATREGADLFSNILIEDANKGISSINPANEIDYEDFTAYYVSGDNNPNELSEDDYSEDLTSNIAKRHLSTGIYSVYTHTIDNYDPVYLGKIEVSQDENNDFGYHWTELNQDMTEEYRDDIVNEASNDRAIDANYLKYMTRHIKYAGKKGMFKMRRHARQSQAQMSNTVIKKPEMPNIEIPKPEIPTPQIPSNTAGSAQQSNESFYYDLKNKYKDNIIDLEEAVMILNEDKKYDTILKNTLYDARLVNDKAILNLYKELKPKFGDVIKYTYPRLERYNGLNLYFDLAYYNQAFLKQANEVGIQGINNKTDRIVSLYSDLLLRFFNNNRTGNYTKKTVFIPIEGWIPKGKRIVEFKDGIQPISLIYRLLMINPESLKTIFKDMDVVIFGYNRYFKINFSTVSYKGLYNKFKMFANKLYNDENFDIEDVDTTPDNQETPKAIATNIADNLNDKKKIPVSYNLLGDVSKTNTSLDVPAVTKPSRDVKHDEEKFRKEENKKTQEADKKARETVDKELKKTGQDKTISTEDKEKIVANQKQLDADSAKLTDQINDIAATSANTDDAMNKMNDDQQFAKTIMAVAMDQEDKYKISQSRKQRMDKLEDEFQKSKINGKTVKDIINEPAANDKLESTDIKISSPFQNEWSDMKYMNFDRTYDINDDIVKMINELSNKQYPLVVRDLKVEDNSTSQDYVDLYTVQLEDSRGKRYTIKFDVPKFKDNKYLILRGNKKTIQNQYFNMPIIKTDVDTCQIISNYNKIFVRRFGGTTGKSISYADKIVKALNHYEGNSIKYEDGYNQKINDDYDLPFDYIDLGNLYNTIEINTKSIHSIFYFNQKVIREKYKDIIDDNYGIPFGYNYNNKSIYYFKHSANDDDPISARIARELCMDSTFEETYTAVKPARKHVYSQASILATKMPLIILCAYSEGLLPVLNKAHIKYQIVPKLTREIRSEDWKDWIVFADGYLVYDLTYESSLLLNGLKDSDTENYNLSQINSKRMYTELMDDYGGRIKCDGMENFYECEIDPITKEVLEHYHMPTDYISVVLEANKLLADNQYVKHIDSSSRRLRRNELVAVKVYKALFNDAYSTYANKMRQNQNLAIFSMKQDAVVVKFMEDNISSDLSVINCLNDVDTINSVTAKGESGMNTDRSYTLDKRLYDDSMINLLGMSTGFAGTVGVTRQATINMNIEGKRGYVQNDPTREMNTPNTLTITEAMTPMGSTHDDPIRTAMTFVQTAKHQMQTEKMDPLLVTSGADEAMPYLTSDVFSIIAKEDGQVLEFKPDQYIIVKYKSGKKQYIDLRPSIEKNSDGGFYVETQLITKLSSTSHFKKDDILAYEKGSFSNSLGESKNLAYNIGTLLKVGILSSDENFEDSAVITYKASELLSSDVVMKKDRYLSKNTNIYNVINVGSDVQQGDVLMESQDAFEEEDVNNLLRNLAGDKDKISQLGRKPLRSDYTGRVAGIKVYRTVDLEELSPSLQALCKKYEAPERSLKALLKKNDINDPTLIGNTDKLPASGKLKKAEDGVLIEFYISYHDKMGIGVANYSKSLHTW